MIFRIDNNLFYQLVVAALIFLFKMLNNAAFIWDTK